MARSLLLTLALAALALPISANAEQPAAPAAMPAPAQDPVRLAAARITVDHIFPAGTYAKLMSGAMSQMLDQVMDAAGQMPLRDLAGMVGTKPAELAKLDKGTLNDVLAILDPAHQQRMVITMHELVPVMTQMMSDMEPGMREGLAHAYANRFTPGQLGDMNAFFDTPSGSAYAANAMLIQTDPEVIGQLTSALPRAMRTMMSQMPAIAKRVDAASAGLPKPRHWADLSPAERTKLAQLLGVSEESLAQKAKAREKAVADASAAAAKQSTPPATPAP
jgi:hypothetical protein